MAAVDDLPPDQRAVLQMVLRGRTYEQIAGLLSIDPEAVHRRALDGVAALTPAGVAPAAARTMVTDYLLGQLSTRDAQRVYRHLETVGPDRDWALALASELAPLSAEPLPEIPVGAPLGADARSAGGHERDSDPPRPARSRAPDSLRAPRSPRAPQSSRRGGAALLAVIGVVIIALAVIVYLSGGPSGNGATHTGRGGTTGSTTQTTSAIHTLALLELTSPSGSPRTVGLAQVVRTDGLLGVVIDARGMPANTPHDAYALWLYNSAASHRFLGFIRARVGKSGTLITDGQLPAGASAYHRLLITLETQRTTPARPGDVVLDGPFKEGPAPASAS